MYVCMYVCMCEFMCVCMHACICVCVYVVCMPACIYVSITVYVWMDAFRRRDEHIQKVADCYVPALCLQHISKFHHSSISQVHNFKTT